ncbi:Putative ribosomal protein uS5 domain 2-type superfamily [Colletotrichum destructivum]|uniref:Ribosomal protein uS5 domain 2-type superfamily n=1 Tax=Colletotrichum destructivum TaxID=34406 RepID=A0AAX4ISP0_9PEZI|nr:Putative ribosomal protein uS5 domain 2-type superfamily [Colletotrichum destructivum]
MASQQDLQDLLRIITSRKGVSMMAAMGQVKALQARDLLSIKQISDAPFDVVERALGDSKAARSLQAACKVHLKRPNTKRAGESLTADGDKRAKNRHDDSSAEAVCQSAEKLEDALALPIVTDEWEIAKALIYTNRAPFMLAFVVELLRCTMPLQPLSSRLSLAQAVVSANARTKAVGIGLANTSDNDASWGEGQPKVSIMGRSIAVLKRGDYQLAPEAVVAAPAAFDGTSSAVPRMATEPSDAAVHRRTIAVSKSPWSISRQITFKSSTFVARVASVDNVGQASALTRSLLSSEPLLQTATHNAWGFRMQEQKHWGGVGEVRERCEDDGETGCGQFILRLMREASVTNVVVVLSRWFGGEMLGPDRWRLMRNVITEALSQRLRLPHSEVGAERVALWALDLQRLAGSDNGRSADDGNRTVTGAPIFRPESARSYLLKSFASSHNENDATSSGGENCLERSASRVGGGKLSKSEAEAEMLRNLGRLLGAFRLLFESWSNLTPPELNRRAFSWYTAIRPEVEPGIAGWGAKGCLKLSVILHLRRSNSEGSGEE